MTSTKWWWKKQSKPTTNKTSSIKSSTHDDGSMLSLHSDRRDGDSVFAASTCMASSTRAQHARSEYSCNFSDIESNTSIKSKPWISRDLANIPSELSDTSSIASSNAVDDTTTNDELLQDQHNQKRRGSLVDYFSVNKPLQGKLKAGLGKLIRSQTNDSNQATQSYS